MKKRKVFTAIFILLCAFVLAYSYICPLFMPSMQWARNLKVEEIKKAELFQFPASNNKPYSIILPENYERLCNIINNSKGKFISSPKELTGGFTAIYITSSDGEVHKVSNIGNCYLVIDGDYFSPGYKNLSLWDNEDILKGTAPAPENFQY